MWKSVEFGRRDGMAFDSVAIGPPDIIVPNPTRVNQPILAASERRIDGMVKWQCLRRAGAKHRRTVERHICCSPDGIPAVRSPGYAGHTNMVVREAARRSTRRQVITHILQEKIGVEQ